MGGVGSGDVARVERQGKWSRFQTQDEALPLVSLLKLCVASLGACMEVSTAACLLLPCQVYAPLKHNLAFCGCNIPDRPPVPFPTGLVPALVGATSSSTLIGTPMVKDGDAAGAPPTPLRRA